MESMQTLFEEAQKQLEEEKANHSDTKAEVTKIAADLKAYKEAVQKAYLNGVEIKTIQVEWNEIGEAIFIEKKLS